MMVHYPNLCWWSSSIIQLSISDIHSQHHKELERNQKRDIFRQFPMELFLFLIFFYYTVYMQYISYIHTVLCKSLKHKYNKY